MTVNCMRFKTDVERRAMFANMNGIDRESKFSYAPVYVLADIPAMGVDVAGTAGATVVGAVPLIATLGIGYIGADMALKTKDRLMRQYEAEKHEKRKKRNRELKLKKIFGRWN